MAERRSGGAAEPPLRPSAHRAGAAPSSRRASCSSGLRVLPPPAHSGGGACIESESGPGPGPESALAQHRNFSAGSRNGSARRLPLPPRILARSQSSRRRMRRRDHVAPARPARPHSLSELAVTRIPSRVPPHLDSNLNVRPRPGSATGHSPPSRAVRTRARANYGLGCGQTTSTTGAEHVLF
jgi:hypothetical protein